MTMKVKSVNFAQRALIKRLVLGGLAISITAGALTLFAEGERIDDIFVTLARNETIEFTHNTPGMNDPFAPINQEAITRGLTDLVQRNDHNAPGDYVIAELYDANFTLIAEASEQNIDKIEQSIDRSSHQFPNGEDFSYQKYLIDGAPYLLVITPLHDGKSAVAGYLEGVYRISPETVESVRAATIRMTIIVVMAVLATTLLLYPIISRLNRRVMRHGAALLEANLGTLRALGSAVAKRDSDTSHHNYRVTLLAIRLGEKIGLDAAGMRGLIKGAFLHDVGKIAIPDQILLKPGKLTAEEFETMKTHVCHGIDIVSQTGGMADAIQVVGGHHEKFNGGGYPAGTRGSDIPISARIFAIADVFDALTSERPYKKAFSFEESLELIAKDRGSHFDPALVDAFLEIATSFHQAFAGRDEVSLGNELKMASSRYFTEEILL